MKKILLVTLLLSACASPDPRYKVDPVEILVPTLDRATAPEELFRQKVASEDLPRWVAPTDPKASVCLGGISEPKLKNLLSERESLLEGWEEYSKP